MNVFSESDDTAAAWYGGTPRSGGDTPPTYCRLDPTGWPAPAFGLLPEGAAAAVSAGETVLAGRYRLGEILGMGGFATVYGAWDLALRRRVAVKTTLTATAGRLCEDEARFQATCQHPNVMPLHDAGQDPLTGLTYLVMPCYPGADLAAILNRHGPMPYRAALLCIDQIASALDFLAQRRGALHGDVKPSNIWLTPGGSALLMDFNLHGLLARGEARAGTPGYTAPEALQGRVSPASDVFSLACVLYACLTGTPAFADDAAVRSGVFAPLRKLRPDIRPELARAIETGLAADPARRYASAREFQTALRRPARGQGFPLFLLCAFLRGLAGTIGAVYRKLWRLGGKMGRHIIRRPKQALVELFLVWFFGRYLWIVGNFWVSTHRHIALIATIALLVVSALGALNRVSRLHGMWRGRR